MKKRSDGYDAGYYKGLKGQDALWERLMGRLPIIEIEGHPFFVDVRLGLLRPRDNFMTMGLDINNGGWLNQKTNHRLFYYHVPTMTEAKIPEGTSELPSDTVMIRVPDAITLDPVASARLQGLPHTAFLEEYPLLMYSKAQTIDVKSNRLKDMTKSSPKQRTVPRNNSTNKKKGRGI